MITSTYILRRNFAGLVGFNRMEGKNAIETDSIAEVITTLQVIRSAVDSGELDKRIEAVMGQVKAGFTKATAPTARATLKLPAKSA